MAKASDKSVILFKSVSFCSPKVQRITFVRERGEPEPFLQTIMSNEFAFVFVFSVIRRVDATYWTVSAKSLGKASSCAC